MLSQLVQHLSNGLHMLFAFAFGIDKDVIEVHYHKNVKLLYQNLMNIALERGRYIGQSKKHHLVLKMAIASLKSYLPSVSFFNCYLMIGIG